MTVENSENEKKFTAPDYDFLKVRYGPHMDTSIEKLTLARKMLAKARTLEDIVEIRDMSEAFQKFVKAQKLGREAELFAIELTLLAERKAGSLLAEMEKAKGGEHAHHTPDSVSAVVTEAKAVSEYRKALHDSHVSERKAERWQEQAKVPEEKVHEYISHARRTDDDVTRAGLLRFAPVPSTPKPPEPDRRVRKSVKETDPYGWRWRHASSDFKRYFDKLEYKQRIVGAIDTLRIIATSYLSKEEIDVLVKELTDDDRAREGDHDDTARRRRIEAALRETGDKNWGEHSL